MKRHAVFGMVILVSLFNLRVWADVQGRIMGVVVDSIGSPLGGVRVTIISQKTTSNKFELVTDKTGKFIQVGLWPGYYQVSFNKAGYMNHSREVRVMIAETTELEIKLEKGDEFVERNVSAADKIFLKANKLFGEQKYEEALRVYQEAIQKSSTLWGYHFNLGLTYKKLNRKEEALASFKKALELNPESYSSNKEIGEILALDGRRYGEAVAYYKRAAELSGEDPDGFYNLGVCLMSSGEAEAAIEAFSRACELDPNYADAYYHLGTLFVSQNKTEEAIKNLEKFLQLSPEHEKAAVARQLLDYLKK